MARTTKNKSDGLLFGQKLKSPKSRRKRKLLKSLHLTATVTLLVIFIAAGIYLARKAQKITTAVPKVDLAAVQRATTPVQFSFDSSTALNLPQGTQKKINDYIASNPPNLRSQGHLLAYTQKLQEISGASSIQLIRTGEDRIVIRSHERQPVLRIAADKIRLITAEGLVYGVAEASQESLPILTGLLDVKGRKVTLEQDGSAVLRPEEQQAIQAALVFSSENETNRYGFKNLEWLPYRGIEARNEDWDVVFGMPPYGERYQKLVKIISDLNKKGVTAAKVELDYPDKAFVKQLPSPQQQNSSGL